MSDKPTPQNKTPLIVMSVLGLIVMAVIAFVFTRPAKQEMVTDLYLYYPQDTAFFMELKPSDKLAARFLQSVDKLKALAQEKSPHGMENMETLFQNDFETGMSIGAWKPQAAAESATPAAPQESSLLVVLPLKKGMTFEKLATDMKLTLANFTQTKEGDATLVESKDAKHPFLAIHKDHLLVAANMDVLKQAIAEFKTPESIITTALYKQNMGLLPANRQGTLLMLTAKLQDLSSKALKQGDADRLAEFQKQLQAATPVMVAGITIDQDQFVKFDSFTPVDLMQIKDETFRKDIKALMARQDNFDLPGILPKDTVLYGGMVGLGSYFDIFMNHMATNEDKESMAAAENQLKMLGLDFRKNLIGLLDGKSAISVVVKPGQPDILLFLAGNPDTQKTLDQFSAMAAQMSGGKVADKQIDASHTVKVLESPAMPLKVGYSSVQPDTLVLGTQSGLEDMYNVKQKKAPSLDENKLYKELAAGMPQKVNGVFFLDVNQSVNMLDDMAKKSPGYNEADAKIGKEVLGGIEGIAGSNTMDGEKMLKGHMTIKLSDAK